ncbi:hypothetical protein NBRC116601_12590 [Cognatishimia sp. WU-CL00825]|uniref:hypothetical protein n=1 Tax=Cognatishimia sp. WU-CL00825 TaxID=3127658 RepID=UPI00310A8ABE
MRTDAIGLILVAALTATSPLAEEQPEHGSGKSLMQMGAEMFFKGLTDEMEPALEELRSLTQEMGPQMLQFFAEMGPAFGNLLEEVEDWSAYEAPEMLPNGDIIIRRKPRKDEQSDAADEAIEL